VARNHEVLGVGPLGGGYPNGVCPVCGRNTRGHPLTSLDADGKSGVVRALVVDGHHGQSQTIHTLGGHAQTDQPTAVSGHKIDVLRGNLGGCDSEIALVLPVLVVHQDDHTALSDVVDGQAGAFVGIRVHHYKVGHWVLSKNGKKDQLRP